MPGLNDYGNGVQKRVNACMCYCCHQECGWNAAHNYGFHAALMRDPGTFDLPADHDYCKLSGKTVGVVTGSRASEGSGSGTQYQCRSDLSELISNNQGEANDATFPSFLTDFYNLLDNLK